MYLVLGDWSDDGHGKTDKVLLESTHFVHDVKQAYKDSCKLTGVAFHSDNPGEQPITIACDYEDPYIPKEAMEIFITKFGLTYDIVDEWDFSDLPYITRKEFDKFKPLSLNEESIVNAWIWFVRLSHPEIEFKTVNTLNEIPYINGYWDDTLNVQFGYGIYH